MDGPPVDLHLIFKKSSPKNGVRQNQFLVYFELEYWRLDIKFEMNQKWSSLNSIFRNPFIKNQPVGPPWCRGRALAL